MCTRIRVGTGRKVKVYVQMKQADAQQESRGWYPNQMRMLGWFGKIKILGSVDNNDHEGFVKVSSTSLLGLYHLGSVTLLEV